MRKRPEVLVCYLVLGEADFILKVTTPDLDSFQQFLLKYISSATGVSKVVSTVTVKQEKVATHFPIL
jgi:Lrp/AsnC family transcriptional regulator, leucine-responsive regulatory protein